VAAFLGDDSLPFENRNRIFCHDNCCAETNFINFTVNRADKAITAQEFHNSKGYEQ
jgi:hypothetical protein